MIKRSFSPQFRDKILCGEKTTTIRDNPWPVGAPIMAYNWSGLAYRSKHRDIAPVIVKGFWAIRITHRGDGGMLYAYGRVHPQPIHETEGFGSRSEMDAWFRLLVAPGQTVEKALMLFRLANVRDEVSPPEGGASKSTQEIK